MRTRGSQLRTSTAWPCYCERSRLTGLTLSTEMPAGNSASRGGTKVASAVVLLASTFQTPRRAALPLCALRVVDCCMASGNIPPRCFNQIPSTPPRAPPSRSVASKFRLIDCGVSAFAVRLPQTFGAGPRSTAPPNALPAPRSPCSRPMPSRAANTSEGPLNATARQRPGPATLAAEP